MNWLDIAIIILLGVCILLGWKTGLLGAAFSAGGAAVGVFLAGRFSDDVAGLFTDSATGDTLASVLAYAAILAVVFVAVQMLRSVVTLSVKAPMKVFSMAWLDNLGGAVLGFALGLAMTAALLATMARLASNLPTHASIEDLDVTTMARSNVQSSLNDSLLDSALVPACLAMRGALPGSALGFVPDDYATALDVLEAQMDGESGETP